MVRGRPSGSAVPNVRVVADSAASALRRMLDKVDSSVRACVVSGRPIFQSTRGVVRCRTCRARAYEEELLAAHLHHCPLCHNTVDYR